MLWYHCKKYSQIHISGCNKFRRMYIAQILGQFFEYVTDEKYRFFQQHGATTHTSSSSLAASFKILGAKWLAIRCDRLFMWSDAVWLLYVVSLTVFIRPNHTWRTTQRKAEAHGIVGALSRHELHSVFIKCVPCVEYVREFKQLISFTCFNMWSYVLLCAIIFLCDHYSLLLPATVPIWHELGSMYINYKHAERKLQHWSDNIMFLYNTVC